MTAIMRPLAELTQQATTILIRELGVVDALRFLSQMRALETTPRSSVSGWMTYPWTRSRPPSNRRDTKRGVGRGHLEFQAGRRRADERGHSAA